MTNEAKRLLEKAMESVGCVAASTGRTRGEGRIERQQAESAARDLSNAGVLVLGFDMAATSPPTTARPTPAGPRQGEGEEGRRQGLQGREGEGREGGDQGQGQVKKKPKA
jgi:hypothetical protein